MSSDSVYHRVAHTKELPLRATHCVELLGREILLCHTAEGIFAVDNLCTHAAEKLQHGRLKGCKLFCPLHGASFDVRNGAALSRPAVKPLASYPVKIQGADILVAVEFAQ